MNEYQEKRGSKGETRAHLPDETIVQMYWERNEQAIEETEHKYGKYLFTIAYNIVHDNMDCEECLNDTYLGAWNKIPPTRPSIFQAFLSRIMRNIAINRYKRNAAAKRIPSELLVSLEELDTCMVSNQIIEEEMAVKRLSDALNSYLESLSERKEFIFVCRYYYADKITEIAKMLKISEKTVSRELIAIREGLKKYLESEGILYV